jgi:uncharacterized membrane-anchored protein
MTIAQAAGIQHRFGDGLARDRIGTERIRTYREHPRTAGKLA